MEIVVGTNYGTGLMMISPFWVNCMIKWIGVAG